MFMNVHKDKMNMVSAQKARKTVFATSIGMLWSSLNLMSMPILQHQ